MCVSYDKYGNGEKLNRETQKGIDRNEKKKEKKYQEEVYAC